MKTTLKTGRILKIQKSRDNSKNNKIDEKIDTLYLMLDNA
jgi:hypothetical protein